MSLNGLQLSNLKIHVTKILTCNCHKNLRAEAISVKWPIKHLTLQILVSMCNLGRFREKFIFCYLMPNQILNLKIFLHKYDSNNNVLNQATPHFVSTKSSFS